MYALFSPKAVFQGMPPAESGTCLRWIQGLLDRGRNFVALRGARVIGHVVILPDMEAGDAEYLIFVAKEDRNRGVGSRLTRTVLEHSEEIGLRKIWLTVSRYNYIAIRLYRRFGFDFIDPPAEAERAMVLWL
jgi:ribosomal protein S18 acetylase RimI-like enzyme